jgi:hypothetical protein
MTTERENDTAKAQAAAQLAGIAEMVAALQCDYDRLAELRRHRDDWEDDHGDDRNWTGAIELADLEEAAGDCADEDDARRRIEEDALSVEVRSDWHTPGGDADEAEYQILLCTGGPACRIIGELDESSEPCKARIEHQDWFKPWTDYPLNSDEEVAVLAYCRCFYFGS